ncbi:sigma-70 family RNA polymerase sigma factor [Calycomorphotria hydatis]|uniref:ECF RNA polymerase sigma factor SigE n=1 Tax=Calycomorphotria hydatis TaxID=2528027 RepID=A0A517TDS3_9PLAN|nr:sigma-70 family RNA polymerase sigma factor [Calycomorphotria hydatis]QDT66512.1 ECF RNA polymerase sigma factor SigE [Calycomorphotria hydatis]
MRQRPMTSSEKHDPSGRDRDQHAAFLRLLAEAYPRLHSLAITIVGDANDADDVLQEVSIQLWEKFDDFQQGTNFSRWAASFVINYGRNFCRKRQKRRGEGLSDAVLGKLAKVHNGATELMELRRERLQQCLNQLVPKEREFLWACYSDDTSVVELARERGITKRSIYNQLYRVRQRLFDCINKHLGAAEGGAR